MHPQRPRRLRPATATPAQQRKSTGSDRQLGSRNGTETGTVLPWSSSTLALNGSANGHDHAHANGRPMTAMGAIGAAAIARKAAYTSSPWNGGIRGVGMGMGMSVSVTSSRSSARTPTSASTSTSAYTSTSAQDAELIASLRHEIALLRESLAEERSRPGVIRPNSAKSRSTNGDEDNSDTYADACSDASHQHRIEEAEQLAINAEQEVTALRAQLENQSKSFELTLAQLRAQIQSNKLEKTQAEKHEGENASPHQQQSQEIEELLSARLDAATKHRDRVEEERWREHKQILQALQDRLQSTTKERDELRSKLHQLQQTYDQQTESIRKERLELLDKSRQLDETQKEQSRLLSIQQKKAAEFDEEVKKKRRSLEMELKKTSSSHAPPTPSASSSSSAAANSDPDEVSRLRRALSALEAEVKELRTRDTTMQNQWEQAQQQWTRLTTDLEMQTQLRSKLQQQIESMTLEAESAAAAFQKQIEEVRAQLEVARKNHHQADETAADAEARVKHLQKLVNDKETHVQQMEKEGQEARDRILQLQSELSTLHESQNQANTKHAQQMQSSSTELRELRSELESTQARCRALEAQLAELQAMQQQNSRPMSPTRSPSLRTLTPSGSRSSLFQNHGRPSSPLTRVPSTHALLNSPLSSSSSSGSASSLLDHASRRSELDSIEHSLNDRSKQLDVQEKDLDALRAVLEQQRLELVEEQKTLQSAAKTLHSSLLAKLSLILPLNYSIASNIANDPSMNLADLTLTSVDALREDLRDKSENVQAIEQNLTNEIQQPSTKVHTDSLADRLEALRRACEFHEQRLEGLNPSESSFSNATRLSAASPKSSLAASNDHTSDSFSTRPSRLTQAARTSQKAYENTKRYLFQ